MYEDSCLYYRHSVVCNCTAPPEYSVIEHNYMLFRAYTAVQYDAFDVHHRAEPYSLSHCVTAEGGGAERKYMIVLNWYHIHNNPDPRVAVVEADDR
jgi:hypothetical protein